MGNGTFVGGTGTDGLFPFRRNTLSVTSEQFWGRAARASSDSKESGRLLIFAADLGTGARAFEK